MVKKCDGNYRELNLIEFKIDIKADGTFKRDN